MFSMNQEPSEAILESPGFSRGEHVKNGKEIPAIVSTNDELLVFSLEASFLKQVNKDGNLRAEVSKLFSKIPTMDSQQIRSPRGIHMEKLKHGVIERFSLRATQHFRFLAREEQERLPEYPKALHYVIDKFDTDHYRKNGAWLLQRHRSPEYT